MAVWNAVMLRVSPLNSTATRWHSIVRGAVLGDAVWGGVGAWAGEDEIDCGGAEGLTRDERAEPTRLRKRCAELEL